MSFTPNTCFICQMEFSLPDDLYKHIPFCRELSASGDSSTLETKTFSCKDCPEYFICLEDLEKHHSEHATEKGEGHDSHRYPQLENPANDSSLVHEESSHNDELPSSTVNCSVVGGQISQSGHFDCLADKCSLDLREASPAGQLQRPTNTCSIESENIVQTDQLENPLKNEGSFKVGEQSHYYQLDTPAGECSYELGEDSDGDQIKSPTDRSLHDEESSSQGEKEDDDPTDLGGYNDREDSHDAQLENATGEYSLECGESSHAVQIENPTNIYTSLIGVLRSQESQLDSGTGSSQNIKSHAKYECQICGKLSLNRSYLEQHIRSHTGEKPFKCDMCDNVFAHKGNMKAHRMSHFRKKRRRPNRKSNVGYKKGHSLKYRKVQRNPADPKPDPLPRDFACSYCDKRYVHCSNVEKHERKHLMLKRYSCPECHVYYLDVEWLQTRRFKIQHANSCGTLPRSFNHVCLSIPQVRKSFSSTSFFQPSKFQLHMLEPQVRNPFVFIECSACCSKVSVNKQLHSQKGYQELENTSIPATDYKIDLHDANVNNDKLINNNKRLRRNRKAFKCAECGKWFADQTELNVHLTHAGGTCLESPQETTTTLLEPVDATNVQGGVCSYCQKAIPKRSDLLKHYRAHSRETSYECKKCGLKMTDPSSWRKHERSKACREAYRNRKKQLHKCAVCGQCFVEKSRLKKHFNRHRGSRKFDCGECGQEFSNRKDLTCHTKTHRKTPTKDGTNAAAIPAPASDSSKVKRKRAATKTSKSGIKKDPSKQRLKKKRSQAKNSRSYKCSYCGKQFPIMSHLIRHFRMHTGAKPFKCEYCSETFSYPASLKKHVVTHLGGNDISSFVTSGHDGAPTTPGRADHSYNIHGQQASYDPQQISLQQWNIPGDSKQEPNAQPTRPFKHEALSMYMLQTLDQDTAKQQQVAEIHSRSNLTHTPYIPLQQSDVKSNPSVFAGTQPINYLPQNQFIEPNKPLIPDNLRAENSGSSFLAVPLPIQEGIRSYSATSIRSNTSNFTTHWNYPQSTPAGPPNPIRQEYVNRPLQQAESVPTSVKHTDINPYSATHTVMDPDRLLQELEHFTTQTSQFSSNDPSKIHTQEGKQPYMVSTSDHPLQSKGVLSSYPHYITNSHGMQQEAIHAKTPQEMVYRMQPGVHPESPQETVYHIQRGIHSQSPQQTNYRMQPDQVHGQSPLYAKPVLENVSQSKDFTIPQNIDQSLHQEIVNDNTISISTLESQRTVEQSGSQSQKSQATEGSFENPPQQDDINSQTSQDTSSGTRNPPPIEDVLLLLNLFKK